MYVYTYIYIYVWFSILLDTSVNVERVRYCKRCMHKFISGCSFRLWQPQSCLLYLMSYYYREMSFEKEYVCVCALATCLICLFVQRDYVLACARSRLWSLGLCAARIFLWAAACACILYRYRAAHTCGMQSHAVRDRGCQVRTARQCGQVHTCDVLRFGSKRLRILSTGGLRHGLEIWVNFSCLAFRLQ